MIENPRVTVYEPGAIMVILGGLLGFGIPTWLARLGNILQSIISAIAHIFSLVMVPLLILMREKIIIYFILDFVGL